MSMIQQTDNFIAFLYLILESCSKTSCHFPLSMLAIFKLCLCLYRLHNRFKGKILHKQLELVEVFFVSVGLVFVVLSSLSV